MNPPRRRRRWLIPVILVVALVAVGVTGELLARTRVQERVQEALTAELPGSTGISTSLGLRPVLLDLPRREVRELTVHADLLQLDALVPDSLRATDVDVHIGRAHLTDPATYSDVTAVGTVPMSDLSSLAAARLSALNVLSDVSVRADGERLVATAKVAGTLPLELALRLDTADRELRLVPAGLTVAGAQLDLDSPRLADWEIDTSRLTIPISLDELPAGVRLDSASVEPAGLRVSLSAAELTAGAHTP